MAEALAIDGARHLAGLQCRLRLWLESRGERGDDPAAEAERAAAERARAELCELAAQLLPGATRGAVWRASGLEARADFALREADRRVGVRLVSAAFRPNEEDLDALAFTRFVAARAGVELGSVGVLHLDPEFVRGAGAIDPRALLRHADVTRDVEFLARDLARRIEAQARDVAAPQPPRVEPSPHCRRPERCPFWKRCTREKPSDWIGHLPALRAEAHAALVERGVGRAADVPDELLRTPAQRNARESARRAGLFAAPDLARALAPLAGGADFLDFEAVAPPIPLYPGTRPLEPVPFQWSALLGDAGGALREAEFRSDGARDPRREFAESLVAALGSRARLIAVYSGFESEVLGLLARALPDLAEPLERVRARLFDVLPVLRRSVYHPDFLGSFSLKRVAPVLARGFGWGDLPGVADGGAAARAWLALARAEVAPARRAPLLQELRLYCARDARALALLVDALRALAEGARTPRHSSV